MSSEKYLSLTDKSNYWSKYFDKFDSYLVYTGESTDQFTKGESYRMVGQCVDGGRGIVYFSFAANKGMVNVDKSKIHLFTTREWKIDQILENDRK